MAPTQSGSSETIVPPGPRDVRATIDRTASDGHSDALVVACPPHPQYGGSRSDSRLQAVSERLTGRGVDCLRFDYGPWDEGTGERVDARAALRWAGERYARLGLFGYSFGGAVATLVAAEYDAPLPVDLQALCVLAPAQSLADGAVVPDAVPDVQAPAGLVYGARDDTVVLAPTVEAARQAGWRLTELDADHRFAGKQVEAASAVVDVFDALLG